MPSSHKTPPVISLLHRPFPPHKFPYPYIHYLILIVNVLSYYLMFLILIFNVSYPPVYVNHLIKQLNLLTLLNLLPMSLNVIGN
jgi:hypothetical protein